MRRSVLASGVGPREDEVDYTVQTVVSRVKRLREMSPQYGMRLRGIDPSPAVERVPHRADSPPSAAINGLALGGPHSMRRVYLDYNASAPLLPEVLEAAVPYYTSVWGNPSSIHRLGREARSAVEDAREQVAQLIGAPNPLSIVFTSGGTEAINLALRGYAYGNRARGHHIITTRIEHPAVLDTCRALQQRWISAAPICRWMAWGVSILRPWPGSIRPAHDPVHVIHGNHEVGTLQPLAALG